MRWNTGAKFVQPSGGNILDVHHVEFEPVESPTLPSGNIWYEPTDGQTEHFVYQGTSGLFNTRTAEGISYYENTTLQELAPGPLDVLWDQALIDDVGYTFLSSGSDSVIIGASGVYKMTYHVQFINNTGGGSSDISLQAKLLRNNNSMSGAFMATYLPTQSNGGENYIACSIIRMLNIGDEIKLEVDFLTGSLSSVDVSDTFFEMEFIRHEEFI